MHRRLTTGWLGAVCCLACGIAQALPLAMPAPSLAAYDPLLARCFQNVHVSPAVALAAADEVLRDMFAPAVARLRAHVCRTQTHATSGAAAEARAALDALLPMLDQPGIDDEERLRALTSVTAVASSLGDWQRAIPLHQRAADLAGKVGNAAAQIELLQAIAALQTTYANDPEASNATLQHALSITAALGVETPLIYYNIGYNLIALGQFDAALASLDRALLIRMPAGSVPPGMMEGLRARIQTHRGVVFRSRGDVAQARALYAEALDLQLRFSDAQGRVVTLMHLGALDFDEGNTTQALARLDEAIATSQRGSYVREQQAALRVLARMHAQSGNATAALDASERAHAIETGILRGQNLGGVVGLQLSAAEEAKAGVEQRSTQLGRFTLGVLGLLAVFGVGVAWYQVRLNRRLRQSVQTDVLTGLLTRRELEQRFDAGLLDAGNGGALMLIDLDDFKRVNDTLGHAQGDDALRAAASRLRDHVPDDAVLGRWGGEEFVLLVPACTPDDAQRLAESLRSAFDDTPLRLDGGHVLRITLSLGWVALPVQRVPGMAIDWREWLHLADQATYAAKHAGRNRVLGVERTRDGDALPTDMLADFPRALAQGWIALHPAVATGVR